MKSKDKNLTLCSSKLAKMGEVIKQLLAETNIDGLKLSKATGVPTTTINRLRQGVNTNPTLKSLLPIAEFFSISLSQLIGDDAIASPLQPAQAMTNGGRNIPLLAWKDIQTRNKFSNESTLTFVYSDVVTSPDAFALRVENSDWLNLAVNTILIVDPKVSPIHRDLVVICKNGQTVPTLKKLLIEDDKTYLGSLMLSSHVEICTAQDKILGVVIEYKHQLRNIVN